MLRAWLRQSFSRIFHEIRVSNFYDPHSVLLVWEFGCDGKFMEIRTMMGREARNETSRRKTKFARAVGRENGNFSFQPDRKLTVKNTIRENAKVLQ